MGKSYGGFNNIVPVVGVDGDGLSYKATCTSASASTTTVVIASLSGFGDDYFNDLYYMQVAKNDDSVGNAPEGDTPRKITDYVSATGTFTVDAFSASIAVEDEILVLHESVLSAAALSSLIIADFIISDFDDFDVADADADNERWNVEYITGTEGGAADINTTTAGKLMVTVDPDATPTAARYAVSHNLPLYADYFTVTADLNCTWGTASATAKAAGILISAGSAYDANNYVAIERQKGTAIDRIQVRSVLNGAAEVTTNVAVTDDAVAFKIQRLDNVWRFYYSLAQYPNEDWKLASQVEDPSVYMTNQVSLYMEVYSVGSADAETVVGDYDNFRYYIGSGGGGQYIAGDYSSAWTAADEDGNVLERLEQLQEAINKGTGTALPSNKSLLDIIGAAYLDAAGGFGTDSVLSDLAEIHSEIEHLYALADGGTQVYPDSVAQESIIAYILSKAADPVTTSYNNTTDSLEALSDAIAAVNADLGDWSAQTNLQSLLAALGIPDVAGKSLYTCLITDRLDNATYGLAALETLVDDVETELAKVPKSDAAVTWNATALGSINAEVDTALNTIVPAAPTAGSLNDFLSKASGGNAFDKATDSLEMLSDKAGAFSGDGGAAQDDSVKASLDLAHTDLDAIIAAIATGAGSLQIVSTTESLNQVAASYTLFTGTTQAVVLEKLNLKMPTGAAGGAITSVTIETDDATPGVVFNSTTGAVANLTSEADLSWTGALLINVGTILTLTINGGAHGSAYVATIVAQYRSVVAGGTLVA